MKVEVEVPSSVLVMRGTDDRPVAVPADVVIESERPYRGYQMHRAGHSWEMIALTEGYPSWQAARADVKAYIAEGASLIADNTRKELLELEVNRLDALQAAIWDDAMKGNLPAVNSVLSIIVTRVKTLQLDKTILDDDDSKDAAATVVIPSDDDGYTRGLEIAAK